MNTLLENTIKSEIGRLEDDAYRYRNIGRDSYEADKRQLKADELKLELSKLKLSK